MKRKLIFALMMGVVMASCQNEDVKPSFESQEIERPVTIDDGKEKRPTPEKRLSPYFEDVHIMNNERVVESN